ncbi:MAG: parallel beta-helix domain-containing protein, partial [Daejeonella sp.]
MKNLLKANSLPGGTFRIPWLMLFFTLMIFSCKKEEPIQNSAVPDQIMAENQSAVKEITVKSGGSIQAAVDAAEPGSTIKILPGTYKESVTVNKSHITIQGSESVFIINPGEEENGFTVESGADHFTLEGVTIKGFEENGVLLTNVDGFVLRKIVAIDNGEYGLFPIFSTNGIIDHCTASGHTDTGIYVGQSSNIEIMHCTAFKNVFGIEVENCTGVSVTQNHTYNNVTGIVSVLLPQLVVKTATDILISKNIVHENNLANFSVPGEGFENFVPSGIGILIIGTDRTTVDKNQVKDNAFLGIGVFSVSTLAAIANIPQAAIDVEPNEDYVKITNNNLVHNGTGAAPLPFPPVDLIWDGMGTGNCWSGNNF